MESELEVTEEAVVRPVEERCGELAGRCAATDDWLVGLQHAAENRRLELIATVENRRTLSRCCHVHKRTDVRVTCQQRSRVASWSPAGWTNARTVPGAASI